MKEIAKRVFRRGPEVELLRLDGSRLTGRGIVCRKREQSGDVSGKTPHALGRLGTPLYVFTGDLPAAAPGDTLTQAGVAYTVLKAEALAVGGRVVGLRAVLERKEGSDAGA